MDLRRPYFEMQFKRFENIDFAGCTYINNGQLPTIDELDMLLRETSFYLMSSYRSGAGFQAKLSSYDTDDLIILMS